MNDILENYEYLLPSKDSQEPISLFGIECSEGWRILLEKVLLLISSDYRGALRYLKYAEEKNDPVLIENVKKRVEEEKSKLPIICQIKSKFGTLRIYADNMNDYTLGVISMAEELSGSICEFCGNKGKQTGGGWITTLCRECDKSSCKSGENSVV